MNINNFLKSAHLSAEEIIEETTVYVLINSDDHVVGVYDTAENAKKGYLKYRNSSLSCYDQERLFCNWEHSYNGVWICKDEPKTKNDKGFFPSIFGFSISTDADVKD